MSKCKYCGEEAGMLRNRHKECQQNYDSGISRVLEHASSAAMGLITPTDAEQLISEIASESFLDNSSINSQLIIAFENAVATALDDDALTEVEESDLEIYIKHFGLSQDDLDAYDAYTDFVKAGVLREVLDGKVPERINVEGVLPFNLLKSEKLIWVFQAVPYYEPRTRTSYSGSYSGVSVRVAKGLYYRTGGFRGNPVVTTQTTQIDTGIFGVTTKHVYFTGSVKSFRIRFNKIVSFAPFSDGIAIQRDAVTAKPQIFKTGDGWFTYNLLVNTADLQAS